MTRKMRLGIALTGLALTAAGCAKESAEGGLPVPVQGASAATIPATTPSVPEQARQSVAAGAVLLDVRTPEEYADGHIDGAINIPIDELPARAAELEAGRDVVVYCRSGNRSRRATTLLRERGHGVIDLGPMSAW